MEINLQVSVEAKDDAKARKLWELSAKATGLASAESPYAA
jgi:hypothetical protein